MQRLNEVLTSVKTGATVATATLTTGLSTWIDLIPDNIGKLASLCGLILSLVLIVVHVHGAIIRHKRSKSK